MSTAESHSFNPYSAPLVGPETVDPFQQDDIRIRHQFIDCESNIRTIASVLILGGLILAIIFGYFSLNYFSHRDSSNLAFAALFGVLALLGLAQLVVGIQVRSFRPRARILAIIYCLLWLFFIPFGTIFGTACLWYLVRPAANYVFTPEYLEVIRKTPHVYFQTSAVSWGILITVLVAILTLVAISML